jgi:hypothetical protein
MSGKSGSRKTANPGWFSKGRSGMPISRKCSVIEFHQDSNSLFDLTFAAPMLPSVHNDAPRSGEPVAGVAPESGLKSHISPCPFRADILQKSFRGGERKFLEPLMRLARGDVRDHIASSKIDHGPPQWR